MIICIIILAPATARAVYGFLLSRNADKEAENAAAEPPVPIPTRASDGSGFCPHCGIRNETGGKFCAACGKSLLE